MRIYMVVGTEFVDPTDDTAPVGRPVQSTAALENETVHPIAEPEAHSFRGAQDFASRIPRRLHDLTISRSHDLNRKFAPRSAPAPSRPSVIQHGEFGYGRGVKRTSSAFSEEPNRDVGGQHRKQGDSCAN